jgi:hypothetical protein
MPVNTEFMPEESTKIEPVDMVRIWILTDNYYDALRADHAIAKRYRATPGQSIHAEHGRHTIYFCYQLIRRAFKCEVHYHENQILST